MVKIDERLIPANEKMGEGIIEVDRDYADDVEMVLHQLFVEVYDLSARGGGNRLYSVRGKKLTSGRINMEINQDYTDGAIEVTFRGCKAWAKFQQ